MKGKWIYLILVVASLSLLACDSKEKKAANSMLETASKYFQQEAYNEALMLLDSLNKVYPNEVEARQQALALSREIRLAISREDSLEIVPQMQELIQYTDSLYGEFTLVEVPNMPDENIIRYKGYDPSSTNASGTFLDCYVTNDGTLEIIAATSGTSFQGVNHIQVFESKSNTFVTSDTLEYDGGLNYRFQDLGRFYERLTFSGERAMKMGSFIANAPESATLKVYFRSKDGKKGRVLQLDNRSREAITMSYQYVKALMDIAELQRRLDTHDRRLQIENARKAKEAISKSSF